MVKKSITHNYSADIIRSLAIVCVLIIHAWAEPLNYSFDWWFANAIETIAKVAVPLFIMLSGLLLLDPQRSSTLKSFYTKRLARIGIPLLFWPIFYYVGFSIVTHKIVTLVSFLYDYLFLNMFYHLYFLYIIAGLYVITPFLKKMISQLDRSETKLLILLSLLFSSIVTVLIYFAPTKINYWSVVTVFIPFIGYYIAGSFLATVQVTKKQLFYVGVVYGVMVIVTILSKYVGFRLGNVTMIRYLVDALGLNVMLMSLSLYILLLHLTKREIFIKTQLRKNIWKWISNMSFGIYIIHPLVLYGLNKAIHYSAEADIPWFFLWIKVIVIFSISYILVYFAKKIPVVRLLFGS